MYNFSAGSKRVLGILAFLSLLAFLAVENGKVDVKQKYYDEKLAAAKLAKTAAEYLKTNRLQKGVFIDPINDPNETALIGQEITLITTDRGNIEAKLTTTNPNFAAVIVEMLKEAELERNDVVAVSFTGSLPGLNISVLAALQTLNLQPIIISSVGSSNWGANDPYFTWLDMEKKLYDSGIFKHKSVVASIGGGLDIGRGLSPKGRELILEAITRNGLELINEEYLENSVKKRLDFYNKQRTEKPIKAFINVGGGIASLGATVNGYIIENGLIKSLPMKNFPQRGTLIYMAQMNIPIIHLLNINSLAENYQLPISPIPLPEPGEGEIFVQRQYSLLLTISVTIFLIGIIIIIYFYEKKRHKLGTEHIISKK
jgi:poly-gamma-glutamate system protein